MNACSSLKGVCLLHSPGQCLDSLCRVCALHPAIAVSRQRSRWLWCALSTHFPLTLPLSAALDVCCCTFVNTMHLVLWFEDHFVGMRFPPPHPPHLYRQCSTTCMFWGLPVSWCCTYAEDNYLYLLVLFLYIRLICTPTSPPPPFLQSMLWWFML